ncbi:MAG: acyltransferase [Gammaproteobacteria bacterium]
MKSSNFGYIPALDHLRGFAAILVLFFHGLHYISWGMVSEEPYNPSNWPVASNPVMALLVEGHTAVSLFFVLSGFVFTVGSLHKRLNFAGFYRNRLLRTYPLFLFFLALGVIFYAENASLAALLQSVFFMANSSTAFTGGPFTFVSWSIAVEWQFYLLFPLLLLALQRWDWRILPCLILALIVLRAGLWWQGADMLRIGYWSILGRLDQFLIGMLAGIYYRQLFAPGRLRDWQAVYGAVLVLLVLFVFNRMGGGAQNNHVWILWPTIEAAAWAIFLLGYLSLSRHFPKSAGRVLVALGAVSYSVYLVHYVVLSYFMGQGWDTLVVVGTPITTALLNTLIFILPVVLIASALTFRGIERPFLRRRRAYVAGSTKANSAIEPT